MIVTQPYQKTNTNEKSETPMLDFIELPKDHVIWIQGLKIWLGQTYLVFLIKHDE